MQLLSTLVIRRGTMPCHLLLSRVRYDHCLVEVTKRGFTRCSTSSQSFDILYYATNYVFNACSHPNT